MGLGMSWWSKRRHKPWISSHGWNKHGKGKHRPGGLGYGKETARKAGICMVEGYKTGNSMLPFPNIFSDN